MLLLRQVLELLGQRLLELGLGGAPGGAGGVEHLAPRLGAADLAAQRRAGERLGAGAQGGALAERERHRALAVAERQPRAGAGGDRRHALRLELLRQPQRRERVEAHALAARGDGRQHLGRLVGEEDQHHVGGRLLERLEQRVGGRVVHRVDALEHEHAPARLERRVAGGGDHRLVDVAAQHDVGAAGRDPREVGVHAGQRARLRVLRVRRVAREQLGGERPRGLALARAGRAVEQVGVRGAGAQGGAEDGGGVRMCLEDAHWDDPRGGDRTTHHRRGARRGRQDHAGGRADPRAGRARARAAGAARARRGRAVRAHPRAGEGPGALRRPARGGAAVRGGARAARRRAARAAARERPVGAARSLRRLLARLPGRRPRAGRRGDPLAERARHRRPAARPHAAAADRPGRRGARASAAATPTGWSASRRSSSRRWPAPTTSWPPPIPTGSR